MGNPVESGAAAEITRTVGQWQVPALGGIRTPEQAREQTGALAHGPLTSAQVARTDALVAAA